MKAKGPIPVATRLKLMRDKIEEYKRAGKGALAILRVPTSDAYPPCVKEAMKVLEKSFDDCDDAICGKKKMGEFDMLKCYRSAGHSGECCFGLDRKA